MSSSMDCSLNVADSVPKYIETDSSANFAYARRTTYIKNLPPPPAPKQSEIWKYPDYSTYSSRLLSFRSWPKFLRGPNKQDLARSGFVYTTVGDKVTCFSCGMTMKDWEPTDDAYKEHLRWSQNCIFAHMVSDGKWRHKTCLLCEWLTLSVQQRKRQHVGRWSGILPKTWLY